MQNLRTLLAAALLSAGACASTDYGSRQAGEAPTDKSSSEASFWYQMEKLEEDMKSSGRLVKDPALQEYVETVTCKITGEFCDDLRVYIIEAPSFNASMAPNGMMLVHTGLLLRAENESQIAAVIAHEFVHFEENHLLERYGAAKNANRSIAAFGTLGGFGLIPMLMVASNASGFSQDQETEADIKGLEYLVAAGYNPGSAAQLWEDLSEELAASDDKFKKKRSTSNGWLASHPHIPERVAELKAAAAEHPEVEVDPSAYRAVIRPHLETWLTDELVKQDPGSTLKLIDQLLVLGEDMGVLEYARGRALSLRSEDGDEEAALAAFKLSAEQVDTPAITHRYLGEYYEGAGETEAAIASYQAYLSAAPDARDAALVEKMITDLEG